MALLELRNLIKRYPSPEGGKTIVLDVPELSLGDGEHVALEGAVLSEIEKRKAEHIARSTFGVFSVENRLRVGD